MLSAVAKLAIAFPTSEISPESARVVTLRLRLNLAQVLTVVSGTTITNKNAALAVITMHDYPLMQGHVNKWTVVCYLR